MIPTKSEFKHESNLGGEQVKMTFDENSLGFLADVLINLYSDKVRACVREYATNARDSHIEAGQTRPIEITIPNYLSYFFKVKDYGVGLSKEDIYNIYSKYGASTGRTSEEKTGMLGLGSKAALTYTNQFNVIAIKDGIKINVMVSRDEDGGGSMSILSETETDEHSGVEIIIPVKRDNDFERKTYEFFRFWEPGTVLINEQEPTRPELRKISDRLFLMSNPSYNERSYVIMGSVPYVIDTNEFHVPPGMVAFLDVGEVNFTPSRESLFYTTTTKETLASLIEEYKAEAVKAVQVELDKQPNALEAVNIYLDWRNSLNSYGVRLDPENYTYDGEPLTFNFAFDGTYRWGEAFVHKGEYGYIPTISASTISNAVIVKGFEADRLTPTQKRKLNQWAEENGRHAPKFCFCKEPPGEGRLDSVTTLEWTDVLAIKLPKRQTTSKPKAKPTYDIYFNGQFATVDELDDKLPIWYSTKSEWIKLTMGVFKKAKTFKDIQFIFIGKNRLEKFKKAFPTAEDLRPALTNFVYNYFKNLTEEEKRLIGSDKYKRNLFATLDASRILDPDLGVVIKLGDRDDKIIDLQSQWSEICDLAYKLGDYGFRNKISRNTMFDWVTERYPLFSKIVNQCPYGTSKTIWDDHVYYYLNAAYKVHKEN